MLKVDTSKCILCGVCEAVAPMIFQQDDDNKKLYVLEHQAAANPNYIRFAVDCCPTNCIEYKS